MGTILELLSAGMKTDELVEDYPDLEWEDIRTVLSFTADFSRVKRRDVVTPESSWWLPNSCGGWSCSCSKQIMTPFTRWICRMALDDRCRDQRSVRTRTANGITKDVDFVNSFLIPQ
jgi:hypothetical protein